MSRWEKFVEVFASPGGAVFLLFAFTMFLLIVNLHILHHANQYSAAETTVFQTILANFTGALLLALQSRTKPPDRDATIHTETQTITVKDTPKG